MSNGVRRRMKLSCPICERTLATYDEAVVHVEQSKRVRLNSSVWNLVGRKLERTVEAPSGFQVTEMYTVSDIITENYMCAGLTTGCLLILDKPRVSVNTGNAPTISSEVYSAIVEQTSPTGVLQLRAFHSSEESFTYWWQITKRLREESQSAAEIFLAKYPTLEAFIERGMNNE